MKASSTAHTSKRFDAVVVGAGLAGLVAAIDLAREGHAVALVERASTPGGRAAGERHGGFDLDRGPRALYVEGPAARGLRRLGVDPPGGRPDLDGEMWLGDVRHALPATPWRLLTSPALPGRARWQVLRALMALPRLDPAPWRGRPLSDWLAGFTEDAAATLAMYVRLSTYCHPVGDLDAADALTQLAAATRGVRYLDGGWQTLVDGLSEAAEQARVRRFTGRAVRWSGGAMTLADGRAIEARLPLVAAGPRVADAIYGLTGADALDRGPTVRAACLTVALAAPVEPGFVLGRDAPLYASVFSRSARLGPAGAAVVHLMRNLAPGERGADHREALEAMLDRLRPDWRDHLHAQRWLPEMVVTHRRPDAASGGLPGRPSVEPQPGCFVAGDWVGPRGWLADAAVASAEDAARRIGERLAGRAAA